VFLYKFYHHFRLIGAFPNTYTFTKQMGEYVVVTETKVPRAIVRPSMGYSFNFTLMLRYYYYFGCLYSWRKGKSLSLSQDKVGGRSSPYVIRAWPAKQNLNIYYYSIRR